MDTVGLGNKRERVQGRTKCVFPPRDAYMSEKVYILRYGLTYGVAERGLVGEKRFSGMTTPVSKCHVKLPTLSGQDAVTTTRDV